jgi:NAD(P) transhydrogenase subunit beta
MLLESITDLAYLLGAIAFVWGLRLLSSPDSARKGNILAAIGMGIGIVATFFVNINSGNGATIPNNFAWIFGGLAVGGGIGWLAAKKVQMTAMPQMVSIFNGLGGACAVVLGVAELNNALSTMGGGSFFIAVLALVIGGVAFTGSLLAFGKLEGFIKDSTIRIPQPQAFNFILMAGIIASAVYAFMHQGTDGMTWVMVLLAISLVYGITFVAPIGGADMPVVISLLNSFSGLSAAAAGLIYGNNIMIVGGILVGASGTILTVLMCEAMNRSLINVLIGGFSASGGGAGAGQDGTAKEITLNDLAIQLYYSNSVMIVPGYGLAVAQAQKVAKELDDLLSSNGVDVKYAIHPVAGRMPGHMNVLLAEADVPYPKLLDLEDANSALSSTDIVVIVGANDVVNPSAEDDPSSSIYGMPVLKVWDAGHVVVLKRSMSPGYAGIQNPLFFHDKTKMLFGDAKDSLNNLVGEVKSL